MIRPDSVTAYRFTLRRDGSTALTTGPGLRMPAVCDETELRTLMLDLFERGIPQYAAAPGRQCPEGSARKTPNRKWICNIRYILSLIRQCSDELQQR